MFTLLLNKGYIYCTNTLPSILFRIHLNTSPVLDAVRDASTPRPVPFPSNLLSPTQYTGFSSKCLIVVSRSSTPVVPLPYSKPPPPPPPPLSTSSQYRSDIRYTMAVGSYGPFETAGSKAIFVSLTIAAQSSRMSEDQVRSETNALCTVRALLRTMDAPLPSPSPKHLHDSPASIRPRSRLRTSHCAETFVVRTGINAGRILVQLLQPNGQLVPVSVPSSHRFETHKI